MRGLMIFAAIMVALGTLMAQWADKMTATVPAQAKAVVVPQSTTTAQAGIRSVTIPRDSRGHFQTDARIDGRNLSFMVDTGASVIALNETAAARIGVRPSRSEFSSQVSTANGTVKAARARLSSVDIGGVVVRDVEAMVLPDEALSENLLGMTFLSRLKRFEYANGRLVLEQ